jgi:hypothetical protein
MEDDSRPVARPGVVPHAAHKGQGKPNEVSAGALRGGAKRRPCSGQGRQGSHAQGAGERGSRGMADGA